ncbi:MAG TPA: CPBP family intramembrane glutamic endopeptidase [Thermoanaerobaculia bacterium]|nr:CPBP family intramembrane glutamic endopeptidase [Thermoanaerobaculia bacterium]
MTTAQTRTRAAVPIVWAVAMLVARQLDPWIPIAVASVGMSAMLLAGDRLLMRELFRPSSRPLILGVLGAAVMVAATYLLFPYLVRLAAGIGDQTGAIYSAFLYGRPVVTVLLFVIPIIFAEEVMWRGAFQEWVATRFPNRHVLVVLLSGTVYALAHVPQGSGLLVAVALVCGLFWSALRSASGSLLPSFIAHLAWDIVLILFPLHA